MISAYDALKAVRLIMAVLLAGSAATQAAADEPVSDVKQLAARAAGDFREGHFKEAAEAWEKVYATKKDPAVAFALGQAWRQADQPEKALVAYRNFLEQSPRSPKRAEVKKTIHSLELLVEQRRKDAPPSPAAVVATPAPVETPVVVALPPPAPAPAAAESSRFGWLNKSLVHKWWFWTIVGGVVVVVATTAVVVGTQVHGGPAFPDTGPGAVTSALVRF